VVALSVVKWLAFNQSITLLLHNDVNIMPKYGYQTTWGPLLLFPYTQKQTVAIETPKCVKRVCMNSDIDISMTHSSIRFERNHINIVTELLVLICQCSWRVFKTSVHNYTHRVRCDDRVYKNLSIHFLLMYIAYFAN
jgi:hypothetical protein